MQSVQAETPAVIEAEPSALPETYNTVVDVTADAIADSVDAEESRGESEAPAVEVSADGDIIIKE